MDGKQLKNSILQEAIQGRLVPQDSSEEPASVLLERIAEERQRLIREKKIKKPKTTSKIFRRDGHFYESKNGGEPACIDEEIPFEIPSSWEWVRLGEIFIHNTGKALNSSNASGEYRKYITTSNLYWNNFKLDNLKEMRFTDEELEKCTAQKGDLLVCEGGDIGRAAIWNYDESVCLQNHIHRLRAYSKIETRFFYYVFLFYKGAGYIGGKGIGIQGLSSRALHEIYIPLPPIQEQIRIAIKLGEILPVAEHYEKQQATLDELHKSLPDALRKAIIQEAIQGNLVPQDDTDEPASVLLERIAEERAKLGKKAAKPMSRIVRRGSETYEVSPDGTEKDISDEIPFEIPDTWEWVRLGEVVQLNPRNSLCDETLIGFVPMNYIEAGYVDKYRFDIKPWKSVKSGFTHLRSGDVAIAKITPCFQNRKSMVLRDLPHGYGAGTTELHVLRPYGNWVNVDYLLLFCKSSYFIDEAVFSGTAGQQRVGAGYVQNKLLPLPSLTEQYRIAETLDKLLARMAL